MKLLKNQIEAVSLLVLAGYLYLTAFNILHYHVYEFGTEQAINVNQNETQKSGLFQNEFSFQCTFHHNYSSLHFVNETGSGFTICNPESFFVQGETDNTSKISANYFRSNQLRAPPLSC